MGRKVVQTIPAASKSKRGGARPGAGGPVGIRLSPATRERIRGGVLLDRWQKIAEGQVQDVPHQQLAIQERALNGLMRKVLPDLTQTDLTSGGEPFVIERVMFKSAKGKP